MTIIYSAWKREEKLWMLFVLVIQIGTFCITRSAQWCPDPKMCTCNDTHVECTCNVKGAEQTDELYLCLPSVLAGENFVPDSLNDTTLPSLKVENCGKVVLSLDLDNGTTDLDFQNSLIFLVEKIALTNIKELHLKRSASLARFHYLQSLIIEDVGLMNISDSFRAYFRSNNLSLVQLRNVNITKMKDLFVYIMGARDFKIAESTIQGIEALTFSMSLGKSFRILNTTVGHVKHKSLLATISVKDVTFHSSHFKTFPSEYLFASNVKSFKIVNCTIDNMDMEIFANHTLPPFNKLLVKDNAFRSLKWKAFWNLKVAENVVFANNRISEALQDSLIPNKGFQTEGFALDVRNNSFVCDCRLKWLWQDTAFYRTLIKESTCFEPKIYFGRPLRYLRELVKNDDAACGRIKLVY